MTTLSEYEESERIAAKISAIFTEFTLDWWYVIRVLSDPTSSRRKKQRALMMWSEK